MRKTHAYYKTLSIFTQVHTTWTGPDVTTCPNKTKLDQKHPEKKSKEEERDICMNKKFKTVLSHWIKTV